MRERKSDWAEKKGYGVKWWWLTCERDRGVGMRMSVDQFPVLYGDMGDNLAETVTVPEWWRWKNFCLLC